jgi:putative membrane protein
MIVDARPRLIRIVLEVWQPLTALFLWDCAVTGFYLWSPFKAPELPLTLFGTALALFLGFRDNSAYARWWEGRVLWGLMINASRNLARQTRNFLPDPAARDLRRSIVFRQVAYVNTLRCQLRKQPGLRRGELLRFLPEPEAELVLRRTNVPNGLLDGTSRRVEDARRRGWIDTVQQASMEAIMVDIANAQGGMERLKNTPLPNQYRFLPQFFTRLFCVLLPIGLVETLGIATPIGSTIAGLMFLAVLQIGDDLVDPFANTVHDVPMSAMCRTIEIDLLEAIDEPALPPTEPERGILW